MARFPSSGIALSTLLLLSLGACASKPPTTLSINVAAADTVNPDIYGRPSPVVTRIYELSGTDRFSKGDIFQLLDHDKDVLGGDMLDRSELILQPGESRTIKMPVKDGAKYLGVVAGYRDVDHADWRSVTQMPMTDDVSTLVTVGRLSAKIEETERK
ncbi:type VI secretion system-associated lipoprotein [Aliidongia dinghuensis]|uniref:Type VI secretion system-associated lipoprotein n=1 Tax=Aliidongia dinghuensis TaxID=1867774 RepID=A0A8J2YTV0_9PROT|nr:type VI secretion system lipoprotein TssJ [Aliidongia dinghuensis]GGF20350.1 type VI secretion system-associated lipoprotein [Aliidongia dinghuensis]